MPFFIRWLLVSLITAGWAASAAVADERTESDVRQIWQLLDYLAVDYAGAVKDGAVINPSEFNEMREFARTSKRKLTLLDPRPTQSALLADTDGLIAAVDARSDPSVVAHLARSLGQDLLVSYPIAAAPSTPPDLGRAKVLYQAQCAGCHGASGHADGALAASLNPRPIAFADPGRARERSPFALFQIIGQGISGTSMPSFDRLPEADRWGLAFYVGSLAYTDAMRAQGERRWRADQQLHSRVPDLKALARLTEQDLSGQVGSDLAQQTLAYLRAHPSEVGATPATFAVARQRLLSSVEAYRGGDLPRATDLALSAYLDGVEPLEPALAARDRALLGRLETAMAAFRGALSAHAPIEELNAQTQTLNGLFDAAESALSPSRSNATATFLGSFTILLREGLEALLIVVAMLAFLQQAQRTDVLPYVHAGWIGALIAGGATWAITTYLVGISGANREVTEGLSSLFAAVVLVSVGLWMHQKSMAGRWQEYLHKKLSAALDRKSALFLFGLSFIAVYREVFETILFYAALWGQGNEGAILAGLGAGVVALLLIAIALLRFSRRLPIAQFFAFSSLLVGILAVVLTGKGVAALQEAGWLAVSPLHAPRIELLGIYPSLQPLAAQAIVLLLGFIGLAINLRSGRGEKTG